MLVELTNLVYFAFIKQLFHCRWDFYKEGNRIFTNLNPMVAYEKGLITWARWIDLNLNPQRTRVIFRSVSPKHNR